MKYIIILLVLLTSCGPAYKLKRAQKLIAQAEASGAKVKSDTTYVMASLHVPGVATSIVNPVSYNLYRIKGKDTTIYKDRVKIQFKDSLIYVQCPDSTAKAKLPVAVTQEIQCPPNSDKWKWIALTLGITLIASIIIKK
jgi:hypothetical protein